MNTHSHARPHALRACNSYASRASRLLPLLAVSALLGACASGPYSYNEGSVRVAHYTREPLPSGVGIYLPGTPEAQSIINRGDAFSVRLVSAFICDFRESTNASDALARGNTGAEAGRCQGGDGGQHPGTRGEIAIVASVGERRANAGLTFDPASVKNGRLVYYNEDVRETGQLINAINLPVYGPKTYDGLPFYMDWSVLELDNKENAAARKLLQQLAEIGTLAAAPYTPMLKMLNTLGSALIDANNDDLEMRFQMETDAYLDCTKLPRKISCGNIAVSRLPLREGYYAFIRSENRSAIPTKAELQKLTVCDDLGTLCAGQTKEPWREKTWLLVRVAREDSDAALAQDAAQELAGLMDALNAGAAGGGLGAATLKGLSSAVKETIDGQIDKQIAARPKKN